jgi:hypothetical protein
MDCGNFYETDSEEMEFVNLHLLFLVIILTSIKEKLMPVPEGVITTTEILQPEPEVVEEVVEEKEEPK